MSGTGTSQAPTSRDKILDVAEARFARSGFGGVGMREVAAEVGLGKSSLFHHFPTKDALYFEVVGRVLERIAVHLAPSLSREGTATARLDRTSDALVDGISLGFHEMGHAAFGLTGNRLLTAAGGTIFELGIPLVAAAYLIIKQRDPFGATVRRAHQEKE